MVAAGFSLREMHVGAQHAEPKESKFVGANQDLPKNSKKPVGAALAAAQNWARHVVPLQNLWAVREPPLQIKLPWARRAVPLQLNPFRAGASLPLQI